MTKNFQKILIITYFLRLHNKRMINRYRYQPSKKELKNDFNFRIFRIAIKFQTIFEFEFNRFNFCHDSDKNLFELKYKFKIIS
jgi:hypothetical protein